MENQRLGASGPTDSPDPRLTALVDRLSRAQRRSTVIQFGDAVVWGIVTGLAVFCLLQLAHALLGTMAPWLAFAGLPMPEWLAGWRSPPAPQHALVAFAAGLASLGLGLVLAAQNGPGIPKMARAADRRFNMDERMSTALEVAAGTAGQPGIIAEALVRDAEVRTGAVDPNHLAPVRMPRSAVGIPLLLVVATWLTIAPPPALLQDAIAALRPATATEMTQAERDEAAARLRAVAAILKQDGEERADPQLQAIARALEVLGDNYANKEETLAAQMMAAELEKLMQLAREAYARAGETPASPRNLSRLVADAVRDLKPKAPPGAKPGTDGPMNQLGQQAKGAGRLEPEVNTMPANNPFTGLLTNREEAGRDDFAAMMQPGTTLGDMGAGNGAPGDGVADAIGDYEMDDDFFGGGAYEGFGAGGELVGGADGAAPGDYAGVGTRELFGNEGRLRRLAGTNDMMLQNNALGQGRRTRFNLLPPPTEATNTDGTKPGEVAGWRQLEEAEVTRAPLPIPSRDVVSRYFRALLTGRTE